MPRKTPRRYWGSLGSQNSAFLVVALEVVAVETQGFLEIEHGARDRVALNLGDQVGDVLVEHNFHGL
jgi:hypothetical protein